MNMAWIYGFASFMLGACLFPITLGLWWPARHRLSASRLVALALVADARLLLPSGESRPHPRRFVFSLRRRARCETRAITPARTRFARILRTCATFIPIVLLGLYYLSIATTARPMRPQWENLGDPTSPRAWLSRLGWVDPISLAIRDGIPGTDRSGPAFFLFAPVVWLAVAMAFSGATGTISTRFSVLKNDGRWCWLLLAFLLVVGGVAGPDSLGEAHGNYLPQRVVLLGLAALVPIFDIDPARRWGRGCVTALVAAVVLQSAIVWDYAIYSDRTAGQMIRVRDAVGSQATNRRAPGFDPQPVSVQSLTARGRLARSGFGQHRLEQLRNAALLLSGPISSRESTGRCPTSSSGSRSMKTRAKPPLAAALGENPRATCQFH